MVLSLPFPSFSRQTSPRRSLNRRTSSSSSTITEALRGNPFGNPLRAKTSRSLVLEEEQERELHELNEALSILARLFPDVKTEVLRELLVRFDGESRIQVCAEQLLRYRAEWVRGRWNVPPTRGEKYKVPLEEQFRSEDYKAAVKTALCQELKALSKSAVDAVLAENNFSYTQSRPILRDLSRKTWRASFGSIFSLKRKKQIDEHPFLLLQKLSTGDTVPRLKGTGSDELDTELQNSLLVPLLDQRKEDQEDRDLNLAEDLNKIEAKAAEALYECDCCCTDATFESISSCSKSGHIICFTCIQRTTHEALFGQGWGKSVDHDRGTIKCLAPLIDDTCEGHLSQELVKRAILLDTAGVETYRKFEDRLASEALLKSQMKMIRCPFCPYAEVDPLYHPSPRNRSRNWHFKRTSVFPSLLTTILLLDLIPLIVPVLLILFLLSPSHATNLLTTSLRNLSLRVRSPRFSCFNPTCSRKSCLRCLKPWHDPHICHEPLLLSLRTTVEAARTAAIKRTCPRCGLSFVKSSGCNKLTCVCGYAMCYLCRKALGPPATRTRYDEAGEGDEEEEEEGYRHFCEHFRINPGQACMECNKCDLYRAEDEDTVVRRAGEKAEREWRIKEGMVGVEGLGDVTGQLSAGSGLWERFWQGRWSVQEVVDWVVEKVIVVDDG